MCHARCSGCLVARPHADLARVEDRAPAALGLHHPVSSANFSPNGFNFEQWKDDEFDAALQTISEATDPATISAAYRKAHERIVDNPPWLFIVHDLNPRAMSPKIKGFVSPQSWFVDLTLVGLQ